jgi:hypothetical protein
MVSENRPAMRLVSSSQLQDLSHRITMNVRDAPGGLDVNIPHAASISSIGPNGRALTGSLAGHVAIDQTDWATRAA